MGAAAAAAYLKGKGAGGAASFLGIMGTGGGTSFDVVLFLEGEGTETDFDLGVLAFDLPLPLSMFSVLADFLSFLLGAGVSTA
jgi:hypothetical protein